MAKITSTRFIPTLFHLSLSIIAASRNSAKNIFLLLFFMSFSAMAAPILDTLLELEQPDGSKFLVRHKGDEWQNWVETAQGYIIAQREDGYWYYVDSYADETPILSLIRADDPPISSLDPELSPPSRPKPRDAMERIRPEATGRFEGKVLFILASFSDRNGTTSEAYWADLIGGSTQSISHYFTEASHGLASVLPASETYGGANNGVVGWVNLGYPHPNTQGSIGSMNRDLTRNAVLAADPYVDFAAHDTDGDGYVETHELAIVVVVAGYEFGYLTTATPSVMGHKSSLYPGILADGVTVGDSPYGQMGYAQFGEIHARSVDDSDAHPATLGIMAHELGHLIFGLPDLYDTDGSSEGIGAFCLMSAGSWGKANSDQYVGQTPVLFSAWVRYKLGWTTAAEGSGTIYMTAPGASSATAGNTTYRVSTDLSNEYFLVENRQPQGYDRGLERWLSTFGGLAIWHIDDNQTDNRDELHRMVDLEAADGSPVDVFRGESTDLWYSGNATLFDALSDPNSDRYDSVASNVSIGSISTSATTMTAVIGGDGCDSLGAPTLYNPANGSTISDSAPTLDWAMVAMASHYDVQIDDQSTFTSPVQQAAPVNSDYTATTLADGLYYWRVRTRNTDNGCNITSNWSAARSFTIATASGGGDLVVHSPAVSQGSLQPGASFTFSAVVANQGSGPAPSSILRYYRSTNDIISEFDTELGTAPVTTLGSDGTSSESIDLDAPTTTGTYYIGACVDEVSGETNNLNNCSSGVAITVLEAPVDIALSNGVPYHDQLSATSQGEVWRYFYLEVPSGASHLRITLDDMDADADLLVRYGQKPYSLSDCGSFNSGTLAEQCDFEVPVAGRWWIAVTNYDTGIIHFDLTATADLGGLSVTPESATFDPWGVSTTFQVTNHTPLDVAIAHVTLSDTSYLRLGMVTCTILPILADGGQCSVTVDYTVNNSGSAASSTLFIIPEPGGPATISVPLTIQGSSPNRVIFSSGFE